MNTLAIDIGGTKFSLALFEDETHDAARDALHRSRRRPCMDVEPDRRESRGTGSLTAAEWALAVRSNFRCAAWRFRRTSAAGPIFLWRNVWRNCFKCPSPSTTTPTPARWEKPSMGPGVRRSAFVLHDAFDRYRRAESCSRTAALPSVSRRGFLGGRDRAHHLASGWPRVSLRGARLLRADVQRIVAGARSRQAGSRAYCKIPNLFRVMWWIWRRDSRPRSCC